METRNWKLETGFFSLAVILLLGVGVRAQEEQKVLAAGGNAFAVGMYQQLKGEKGNLFFSPFSIRTALAMTYAGAAGNTAAQMDKALHYGLPKDKLPGAFGELLKTLNTPHMASFFTGQGSEQKPAYELVVSNALWPAKAYPFKPQYVDLVKKDFSATLEEVDYAKAPQDARKTINDAVARQTKDKIKDLVPASLITPVTRLILTNAIYFKSNWSDKFEKEATKDAPFKLEGGKTANCPMMSRQGHYGYFEADDLQLLEMPYLSHDLSMYVVLPKKADGLAELEKKLSAKEFAKWLGQAKSPLVKVTFPRFKFSGSFSLADVLKAMGMADAFSPAAADFSGMTTAEKLCISDVIHKSFVAVDEEGTEAAAATAVGMFGSGAPKPEEPKVFTADHPFLFLIRHNATGAILFAGRLAAPEGGGDAAQAEPSPAPKVEVKEGPPPLPRPLPRRLPIQPGD